ncbi:MAG TPA: deoxyribodipyrimidine photo-lyase [Methyloceanibacter sp.]|nr:deoxyribodipyrimidine photo-lyase [Methyloceanibacter sp.]
MTAPIIVWFRNDLRLADHPALAAAAETGAAILPLYILDEATPGRLRMGGASRWWLNGSLASLAKDVQRRGGRLCLHQGKSSDVLAALLAETGASAVHATRGYEPWEPELEKAVASACKESGADFRLFGGRLLFEPEAIVTGGGKPYLVFTPFWKACLAANPPRAPLPAPKRMRFADARSEKLEDLRLLPTQPDWAEGLRETWQPGEAQALARLGSFIQNRLAGYAEDRSRLDIDATSLLSPHLHFGEISPNQVWHAVAHASSANARADRGAESYLRELGWREFSYHLLQHFPKMPTEPLRSEFSDFPWRNDPGALAAWQKGQTGYPIVDAAMRELWRTGFMPNRARMIVASFLVKHLLIPWQTGANWFLDTLVDADLANNSASWQWVAGCGTDAAPYFRVFNPVLQGAKFDPDGDYVRRWVPELAGLPAPDIQAPWEAPDLVLAEANVRLGKTYPLPIVDHASARVRALAAFATLRR